LLKLFEFIRLQQENILYDKLIETIEVYMRFLLKYAMRDLEFRRSRLFITLGFDKIPVIMGSKPMIVIEVRIKKSIIEMNSADSKSDTVYKYEI